MLINDAEPSVFSAEMPGLLIFHPPAVPAVNVPAADEVK
jgi:hypothetical protein